MEIFVKPKLLCEHFHLSYTAFGGEGVLSNSDKDCEKAIPALFFCPFHRRDSTEIIALNYSSSPFRRALKHLSEVNQRASTCLCCGQQGPKQAHASEPQSTAVP